MITMSESEEWTVHGDSHAPSHALLHQMQKEHVLWASASVSVAFACPHALK